MAYTPENVLGKVKNTGLSIDGCVLYFSPHTYDGYKCWHLYSWDAGDDRAVMEAVFYCEMDAGICEEATLEEFEKKWTAGQWVQSMMPVLGPDQVKAVTVIQQVAYGNRKQDDMDVERKERLHFLQKRRAENRMRRAERAVL